MSVLDTLSADLRARLRRAPAPVWVEPMLATLTDEPFSDPAWIYERKLDGVRLLCFRRGPRVRLLSRNEIDYTTSYAPVADALSEQRIGDVVIDGEVVAFAGDRTSFELLQRRGHQPVRLAFYAFDVLHLDGYDTRALPLRVRKRLLRDALTFDGRLRFTSHRNREGEAAFEAACSSGWEGVIAKRADSTYQAGRSRDWLKFKCSAAQELVIGGWTDPQGARNGLGALLVGYYEDGRLRYAGKVGTGFDARTLHDLRARLDAIAAGTPPFADRVREPRVHWVEPTLVAQVAFSEWTSDGRLRHPRFLGLRNDKVASDVVRERS